MLGKLFTLGLIMCCATGCRESPKPQAGPAALTNDQLLQLMGGELFEVRVPPDIDPKRFAGLAIRHADGTLETMGGMTGWAPGEVIKIVCFTPDKRTFRYACLLDRGIFRGSTTRFPERGEGLSSPNHQRTDLAPGDRLIRYSKDSTLAGTGNLEGDDFDVVFHIQALSSEADASSAE